MITETLLNELVEWSRRSPRGRIIMPLHKAPEANPNRMLNVMQPGTYIQPHRHLHPPKAETVIVLRGALLVFIFEVDGRVREFHTLKAGTINLGIDSEPGVYHTFVVTEPDTVIFEVKPGPYKPADDKDFATWAPVEGDPESRDYVDGLLDLVR